MKSMSGGGAQSGSRLSAGTRAWQRMLSGRRLDLLDPSPLDIEIDDIAHGLARVARWNGQTLGDEVFSVAQHSLLVEAIVYSLEPNIEPHWRLAALIHDGPEYVIGDLISPFKAAIGLDYKAFELKLLEAIHRRFGLPASLPERINAAIKMADRMAAFFEATQLAGFTLVEANRHFGMPRSVPEPLRERLDALDAVSRGDHDKALWHLNMTLHNNARFLPAIKLKETLLGQRAWEEDGTGGRTFLYRLISQERGYNLPTLGQPRPPAISPDGPANAKRRKDEGIES